MPVWCSAARCPRLSGLAAAGRGSQELRSDEFAVRNSEGGHADIPLLGHFYDWDVLIQAVDQLVTAGFPNVRVRDRRAKVRRVYPGLWPTVSLLRYTVWRVDRLCPRVLS